MDKVKRHIPHIAAVASALAIMLAIASVLASAQVNVPDNPAVGFNSSASHVAWTGEGYTAPAQDMSQGKGRTSALVAEVPPDPDVKPDAENASRNGATTSDVESGVGEGGSKKGGTGNANSDDGDNELTFNDDGAPKSRAESADDDTSDETAQIPPEDPEPDPNEGKYPIIEVNGIEDGEYIGRDWRTFTVRATDWQGRYISSKGVKVWARSGEDETRVYSITDDGYEISYRLPVEASTVIVTIKATDPKGRSTTVDITVHRSDTDDELVVDGTITVSVEAGTVGLGTLIGPVEAEFYEGEQLPVVLQRVLEANGYGMQYRGKLESGFFLQHITKAGITDGWEIPERLMELLESVGYTPTDYHEDSLGEYDFSGTSGWMYFVNDVCMSTGMSSYFCADGDEVRLRFTLYRGSDIGAGAEGGGPIWDEEW